MCVQQSEPKEPFKRLIFCSPTFSNQSCDNLQVPDGSAGRAAAGHLIPPAEVSRHELSSVQLSCLENMSEGAQKRKKITTAAHFSTESQKKKQKKMSFRLEINPSSVLMLRDGERIFRLEPLTPSYQT